MYKCLRNNLYKDKENYSITAIRKNDVELIRLWRNAQIEILRQKKAISSKQQIDYFQKSIWPSFIEENPKQILFSYLLNDVCIGYGGLTHIDWEFLHAEISFLLDPERIRQSEVYSIDHQHFLHLLCQAAFKDLSLHRLFAETFAFRTEHIQSLERFGFKQEGILREHVYKLNQWHDSIIHGLLSIEALNEK